jgi:hypothetical protein
VDFDECIVAVVEGEFGGEQGAAEAAARDFDLFGEKDFFVAGQERYFAHLAEVHADRVFSAATFVFNIDAHFLAFAATDGRRQRFERNGGIGNQLNAEFLEADDEVVEMQRVLGFVRQVGINLRKREVALLESGLNE